MSRRFLHKSNESSHRYLNKLVEISPLFLGNSVWWNIGWGIRPIREKYLWGKEMLCYKFVIWIKNQPWIHILFDAARTRLLLASVILLKLIIFGHKSIILLCHQYRNKMQYLLRPLMFGLIPPNGFSYDTGQNNLRKPSIIRVLELYKKWCGVYRVLRPLWEFTRIE